VALELARELEVKVEDLFALPEPESANNSVRADVLSASPPVAGRPVRLSRVGESWVGVPVNPVQYFLAEADGIVTHTRASRRTVDIGTFETEESLRNGIVVAGCDPAIGLLTQMVERLSGVEVVAAPASSRLALDWLKSGKVHVAGAHLEDRQTGEFNLPYVRAHLAGEDLSIVTFASWEEGFVVARRNPKRIRQVADLASKQVRLVNREPGSGSRALVDNLLRDAQIRPSQVRGYNQTAFGHLAAAQAVANGQADCCIATASAARAYGLGFVPIRRERFDLVFRREFLDLPAIRTMMDVLQRASLRRKLEALAGYDTSRTGAAPQR
jgi:molybdate-binding protein